MLSATAPRTLSPEWRRIVLEVFLEQVFQNCRVELDSNRPVAPLLRVAERLAGRIEAAKS